MNHNDKKQPVTIQGGEGHRCDPLQHHVVTIAVDLQVPEYVLVDAATDDDDNDAAGLAAAWVIEHRDYLTAQIRQGLHAVRPTRNALDEMSKASDKCPFHAALDGQSSAPPSSLTASSSASTSAATMMTMMDDGPTSPAVVLNKEAKQTLMLEAIAKVQKQFFECASSAVVFDCLLSALLKLVDGEYGFIGDIKYQDDGKTMYFQSRAVTNIAWNQATEAFYEEHCVKGDGVKFHSYHSLYGSVMTTGKPVIANDAPGQRGARRTSTPQRLYGHTILQVGRTYPRDGVSEIRRKTVPSLTNSFLCVAFFCQWSFQQTGRILASGRGFPPTLPRHL
jgi:hypothetical protein